MDSVLMKRILFFVSPNEHFRKLFRFISIPFSYSVFTLKMEPYKSIHDLNVLIDFTFSSLIKPLQVRSEIFALLRLLENIRPKYILEIGTSSGGSLFLFSRIATEDARIISIDLPSGPFGGGYSIFKTPIYKLFASSNQIIELIRGSSHEHRTFEAVQNILGGKS